MEGDFFITILMMSVTIGLKQFIDTLNMLRALGFQYKVDFAHIDAQIQIIAVMIDGQDIGPGTCNETEQRIELSRLIRNLGRELQQASGFDQALIDYS